VLFSSARKYAEQCGGNGRAEGQRVERAEEAAVLCCGTSTPAFGSGHLRWTAARGSPNCCPGRPPRRAGAGTGVTGSIAAGILQRPCAGCAAARANRTVRPGCRWHSGPRPVFREPARPSARPRPAWPARRRCRATLAQSAAGTGALGLRQNHMNYVTSAHQVGCEAPESPVLGRPSACPRSRGSRHRTHLAWPSGE